MDVKEIYKKFLASKVLDQVGEISINLAGIKVRINQKDIVGGALQEWFGKWLSKNSIEYSEPSNSQTFPDFEIPKNQMLELKTFNYFSGSPGFDVANFSSYIQSLTVRPERLDADYLILGYKLDEGILSINKSWLLKVWELVGRSESNIISLQVKRGMVYNIRPKSNLDAKSGISGRKEFVSLLDQTIKKFDYLDIDKDNWEKNVNKKYKEVTGNSI